MARKRLRSWAEVGGRVVVARERAGFTQQELADRLELHRSAITRIEGGQRQLDALELARLADALGRSAEWFLTEPPATIASHRADVSADRDIQRLDDALELACRDVELLMDIGVLSLPSAGPPVGISTLEQAQSGAAEARRLIGQEAGPLVDLQAIVERVGLLAFSVDLGSGVADGGYVRLGDLGIAIINGGVDAGRRRFNLAHELGHHLLADEYTTDFGIGTARVDREALINAFAAHLLMPAPAVRRRWEELSSHWADSRMRLVILAAEYRVSWSAVIGHAVNLALITRSEFDLFSVRRPTPADYLEVGVRFEEELRPPALPPSYGQAAIRAYRRSVISADRVVALLRETVAVEQLPSVHELPIEALTPEFEGLDGA